MLSLYVYLYSKKGKHIYIFSQNIRPKYTSILAYEYIIIHTMCIYSSPISKSFQYS